MDVYLMIFLRLLLVQSLCNATISHAKADEFLLTSAQSSFPVMEALRKRILSSTIFRRITQEQTARAHMGKHVTDIDLSDIKRSEAATAKHNKNRSTKTRQIRLNGNNKLTITMGSDEVKGKAIALPTRKETYRQASGEAPRGRLESWDDAVTDGSASLDGDRRDLAVEILPLQSTAFERTWQNTAGPVHRRLLEEIELVKKENDDDKIDKLEDVDSNDSSVAIGELPAISLEKELEMTDSAAFGELPRIPSEDADWKSSIEVKVAEIAPNEQAPQKLPSSSVIDAECGLLEFPLTSLRVLQNAAESDIRCIFSKGKTLQKMPQGLLYGSVLRLRNQRRTESFSVERLWRSPRLIFSTVCKRGTVVLLAAHMTNKQLDSPSRLYVSTNPEAPILPLDGADHEPSLWFDSTLGLEEICPNELGQLGYRGTTFVSGDSMFKRKLEDINNSFIPTSDSGGGMVGKLARLVRAQIGTSVVGAVAKRAGWNGPLLLESIEKPPDQHRSESASPDVPQQQSFLRSEGLVGDLQSFIKSAATIATSISQLAGSNSAADLNQDQRQRQIANAEKLIDEARVVGRDIYTDTLLLLGRTLAPMDGRYRVAAWWTGDMFDSSLQT